MCNSLNDVLASSMVLVDAVESVPVRLRNSVALGSIMAAACRNLSTLERQERAIWEALLGNES